MIAIPQILANAAKAAGITVPDDDIENYDAAKFPHWHVYFLMQCGRRMPVPTAHWDNAVVVATVPANKIMEITYAELLEIGFV